MNKPLILIDPGHGGSDPGALAILQESTSVYREADINLKIAQVVGEALLLHGFDVAYTRCNDLQLTLSQRAELSKVYRPALFLSFHCNAASSPRATGMEVFTSPGRTESDTVAELLIAELEKTTVGKVMRTDPSDGDRDKEEKFVVLTQTACPACLLEFGFMTNPADLRWLLSETAWQQIAEAMINALTTWRDDV
ncbi:N-acetylmuramoyl-L-alanine amidase [Desulfuromonas acetoxidans]|uniref:N-acetylmuramoyl-L-alanine amidase n=1 Tax=Desulfuromonas acetoxidans (strain DSM 684 / 11070) TaxID=281689 RepID=Q1K061_DESA6|nr:N-acetylmuramoyl-L-alanine amidase [Desulfuromonas acetoxidans]EAT16080.1 cell wall hydrolase/autolysin [Desulfuromonas acetoxidans DSM 684]MBF0646896.1 N-acetylmuramoyl-L-alanine amidase [Desulfuromonas acetoxidans]NVD26173.1 N-acetylmuramoyl-L-alanine amidase [Desulfuromonas acetoxidans]NVE18015.1 N-acetylmuramoyl-L-alanine amidase [Desulfuromonas acetoxidans]